MSGAAKRRARAHPGDARDPSCSSHTTTVCVCPGPRPRYAHGWRAGSSGLPRSRFDSGIDEAARATRAGRIRLRHRALAASHELALGPVSDKVPEPGGAMATKRTPAKKTRPKRKATKKRASKAPASKRVSTAPAKKRASKAPKKSSRPTKPAKPRAKRAAAGVPVPVSAPVSVPGSVPVPVPVSVPGAGAGAVSAPVPGSAPASPPASYLEGVPQDHVELVSGLLQVVRGAAKDLKTLVTQAIAMSHQKDDPYDR